ncbi:hypothetical protein Tco_1356463 [Tanacetum coccineum]
MTILPLVMTCHYPMRTFRKTMLKFTRTLFSNSMTNLFDEVLEDIESKDSYVSNLDEPALLVTPLSDDNEDECFDLGGKIDEIDAFLVRILHKSQENGQSRTNTDTGKEREYKSRENAIKGKEVTIVHRLPRFTSSSNQRANQNWLRS